MAASVGALRRLASSVLAMGRIRLELFAIEVQEEKRRVAAVLFWAVLAALAVGFAAVFVAVWLTVLFWETHRALVIGLAGVAWVTLAAVAVVRLRALLAAPSTLFAESLGELRRDEDMLRGRAAPAPVAGAVPAGSAGPAVTPRGDAGDGRAG
jgi:uncharacterized membrane protein YqjE